jgi:hypothetical protein
MTVIDNPKLSMNELISIQKKIEDKLANAEDFEKLDYFLFSTGTSKLIQKKLQEYNLSTYNEYILSRNNMTESLKNEIDKNIQGISLGIISYLKTYLSR